jgi:hypothetical protein
MESRYLGIFEAVETVATGEKPKASIKGLGEKRGKKKWMPFWERPKGWDLIMA